LYFGNGNYSNDAQIDPVGSDAGARLVRRGGYRGSEGEDLRLAYRSYAFPYYRDYANGFWVVRSLTIED